MGHFLKFFKPNPLIGGHSKSKFVEEGRGIIEKRTKTNKGRRVPSICVGSLFLKKC